MVMPHPVSMLSVGVTGHREINAAFAANRSAISQTVASLFERIDQIVAEEAKSLGPLPPVRIQALLADGADQIALVAAEARGWELVAPLPFGRGLNLAINARPENRAEASALLTMTQDESTATGKRAQAIIDCYAKARLFEMAEVDATITPLLLARLDDPEDSAVDEAYTAAISERVRLAGQVMIEQSDFLIGIWDGATTLLSGGTGHTIKAALTAGAPVIRIDPATPDDWHILESPESLSAPPPTGQDRDAALTALVRTALRPGEGGALQAAKDALAREAWHPKSSRLATSYRWIEAMFGGGGKRFRSLTQIYESVDAIATGSAAPLLDAARALPGGDATMVARIEQEVLRRFAWADGISARLSDSYRGGMTTNFFLSAFAIVFGIAYQPFATAQDKWIFAGVEFLLLSTILIITWLGGKKRWHRRWFETRRVAEYFRHAPLLLLLGVARPPGRWPRGEHTSWPEYYARHSLRALGLPRVAITAPYLRSILGNLLDNHVAHQRDYHLSKAERLTRVHHRLDVFSERLFQCAVISVALYLILALANALGYVPTAPLEKAAKLFTFLGVLFPTFGAGIAGIRYFGDFERFAAISAVTAQKLDGVHTRIGLLLSAPDDALGYAQVAALAHATDEIVTSEIESWQAIFGGKRITVPV